MKLFVKKIILFFISLLSGCIVCLLFLHRYSYPASTLHIDENKNILVLGDSQIECALNVGLIKNAYSIAQGGDHHLYSHAQLRTFIRVNKNIDTVILAHNYNNVMASYDYYYNTPSILQYKVPKYFSFLNWEELKDLASKNWKGMVATIPIIVKHNFSFFLKGINSMKDLKLGGFMSIPNNLKKPMNRIYQLDKGIYSELQEKYLQGIIRMCDERNIELILLATPNRFSTELYSKKFLQDFNDRRFSNARKINCSEFSIDSTCFYDYVHLNQKGCSIFSSYLRDSILTLHD